MEFVPTASEMNRIRQAIASLQETLDVLHENAGQESNYTPDRNQTRVLYRHARAAQVQAKSIVDLLKLTKTK